MKNSRKKRNPEQFIERDEVHIKRNFIEEMLLEVRHFFTHNKKLAFYLFLSSFAVILVGAGIYGFITYNINITNEKLYLSQKGIKNIEEKANLLDLLSANTTKSQDNKSKTQKQDQKKDDNSAFTTNIKNEMNAEIKKTQVLLDDLNGKWLYSFSIASDLAKYERGRFRLLTKDYAGAYKDFWEFALKNRTHFFASQAYLLSGHAAELNGKFADALNSYQAVVKNFPKSYNLVQAIYDSGRMQEKLGKRREAEATYKSIIQKYANQSQFFVDKARKRLYLLGIAS